MKLSKPVAAVGAVSRTWMAPVYFLPRVAPSRPLAHVRLGMGSGGLSMWRHLVEEECVNYIFIQSIEYFLTVNIIFNYIMKLMAQ